ncbi:glycoside hydrolase family 3 protein [Occultella glacieicola]|uniref:beta-glucosidase n=1 Tax=Occultella glacieicola TaxID=2518684 RepID=A0ABY2E6R3_9MICO|nr:glycoside hydrolase family 3 N-terminal domain-containing protein [Occultella glacieicola]TDE92582.1 glycoside hydrolase family 3 protein [Occultella glacieicola]
MPAVSQPTLGSRSGRVLDVDGLRFKDLNGNGRLDPYEDWRLPVAERVADLVGRMSTEEKVGLMLITSHHMGASRIIDDPEQGILNTHEKWSETNFWAAESSSTYRFDPPVLDYAGSHRAITELGLRYLIIRDNPTSFDLATWVNALQELAEGTPLGIPVVMVSNPRNHVSDTKLFGIAEASDQMSNWPGELGLAATGDAELVEEFGRLAATQWRAAGITKGYQYMADIVTEPRWSRAAGTFGEDPDLAARLIAAVTRGFQGAELGSDSVSMTTKHFPGGGPRDKGHDPHFEHGRFQPYPTEGSLYRYHLPVFRAAIEAGTTSIMPYYAKTTNAMSAPQLHDGRTFEEVGFAYDKYLITDVLRGELGFTGYVNSDTGISTGMPWGVESLTRPERFAKAIDAGVNTFAGDGNPQPLLDAVAQGLVSTDQLDHNVTYLLDEMFRLGLFENPYVDPDRAQALAEDREIQALADSAHRRSLVLLRNDRGVLPLTPDGGAPARLYVELFTGTDRDAEQARVRAEVAASIGSGVTVVDSLVEATHALALVRPAMSLLSDKPDTELSIALDAATGVDADRVLEIEATVPTVLAVSFANPWLLDTLAPGAAAVVGAFGVLTDALSDLLTGAVSPSGRLPYSIPASREKVLGKASDIPGADEPTGYAYTDATGAEYVFGYGRTSF